MKTRNIAVAAMLSAVAFVLQYIEVPIPIMPSFIKLLGAFVLGLLYGVVIELVKNLIHMAVSQSMFVGELSNFILGAAFTCTAGLIYKHKKTKVTAFVGGVAGAAVMALVSIISNYFVVYPVYYNFMPEEVILGMYQVIFSGVNSILECLLVFNLPFTFVKGLLSVLVTMLIYKPLSPIMKGRQRDDGAAK